MTVVKRRYTRSTDQNNKSSIGNSVKKEFENGKSSFAHSRPRAKREKNDNKTADVSEAMNHLSHVKLSDEQLNLKNKIMDFAKSQLKNYNRNPSSGPSMFVIQGDAGTGKSVILNSLFNEIQKCSFGHSNNKIDDQVLENTSNFLIVNHPEMLKLYLRICKSFKYIPRSSLERPTSLINRLQKDKSMADIVIIDEAHLLSTSKDAFKRFYGENHLQDLLGLSKVLIIVYDSKQALRMGSYWDDDDSNNGSSLSNFYNQINPNQRDWYNLKEQFRVVAPKDVLNWISEISTVGKIPKFPDSAKKRLNYNSDSSDPRDNFDFKIWDDCGAMYEELKKLDAQYGQCRMLATYDFPYRLDGKDYYVTCGDNFKVRWDRYTPKVVTPWSERADTIDEVGSVYTIQGFDLNYAGVILGRSVKYDKLNDCIYLATELYDDRAGFTKKKNINDVDNVKQKIIMNSINVLLTRGVKGLYVYAWDPELRARLADTLKK
ncbi:hypothetical protein TBLA_0A02300 [Henningerozyma blattae CBS 6284]|uniref:Schlafen group 3-like DNA/RNA helicase domain-containing protein n=1 Tax=Henningerozyma blattae (strain ATCC 34711 / CBS 6284 / DSM 70876 / NBRC 10599 / NRRL Y-10934 / UCD 77-7) TaxID=1071380 RepID=I2GV78_HENB6|nr:hypothetical protein TBLA_0A02300 [Tetrapisispora blattae CBS 6284]CCH58030.1 hypothetical protein TBLA_0A02300 [Tetrapisispora blattae CBS 6284]